MTDSTNVSSYDPDSLPPVLARYLDAHPDRARLEETAELFASDARVVDEGIEYSGIEAIRGWLGGTGSAYHYTTTYLAQERIDADRWVVSARLEGDFPGGVAELRYRATVRDDRLVDLVIAP